MKFPCMKTFWQGIQKLHAINLKYMKHNAHRILTLAYVKVLQATVEFGPVNLINTPDQTKFCRNKEK